MKLYHVSKTPDLKILQPRISTHGEPFVYATENLEFAMFFGSSKSNGDFDGIYGIKNGVPYFYEAYPGAFRNRFAGESCYVYEVSPATFEKGKTAFRGEVVSKEPVKILNSKKIDDVYEYLLKAINDGRVILKEYDSQDVEQTSMIEKHIRNRIIKFHVAEKSGSNIYKFCQAHFPQIMQEFVSKK